MRIILSVDGSVDPRELVADIEKALRAKHVVLPRRALAVGGVWFAPMAAWVEGMGIGVKLVGIFPSAQPPVKALAVLFDERSGEALAAADATRLTGWRTAAASVLAVEAAGVRPRSIGVIGAGIQAEYHVRAFEAVFRPHEVLIYSRRRAGELAGRLGARVASLEEVHRADVVIAATNSEKPVVRGSLLRPGSMAVSVGAPKPVRELDEEVKRRARCALIDSPEAAEETDDLAGLEAAVPLEDALAGRRCEWGDIRLYKSVGYAPFDVAAIYHVYKRADKEYIDVELK